MSINSHVALCSAALAGAAPAQIELHLIGTPSGQETTTPTDISVDGRVVVGLNAAGRVYRWDRESGADLMPPFNLPTGSCESYSAHVSADGDAIVGNAGGVQCGARVSQLFHWRHGHGPEIGPESQTIRYDVNGAGVDGAAAGTVTYLADDVMFSEALGEPGFGIYNLNCTTDPWWFYTRGEGVSPDGIVVGRIHDCLHATLPGIIWRGGTDCTRLAQVPVAAGWGATFVISATARWSAPTGWQPILPPGSTARDISWDGEMVVGEVPDGASTQAVFVRQSGSPVNLRTALLTAGVTHVQDLQLRTAAAVSGDGRWVIGQAQLQNGQFQGYVARIPGTCNDIDFNNDGLYPDITDVETLLCELATGDCCFMAQPQCDPIDFNNDMLFPDTADVEAFLRVFAGGSCS